MDLRQYMVEKNLSLAYFSEQLDITRTYFSALLAKRCNPSQKLIRKLEKITDGAVGFNDFATANVFGRCDHCGQLIKHKKKV
tara:strand:- start:864 stop:1109 length:246 start_codon:yes stop_codon:yes gene_type:complete